MYWKGKEEFIVTLGNSAMPSCWHVVLSDVYVITSAASVNDAERDALLFFFLMWVFTL